MAHRLSDTKQKKEKYRIDSIFSSISGVYHELDEKPKTGTVSEKDNANNSVKKYGVVRITACDKTKADISVKIAAFVINGRIDAT